MLGDPLQRPGQLLRRLLCLGTAYEFRKRRVAGGLYPTFDQIFTTLWERRELND
ncbi:hypothetical protein [Streptomyces sp. NPDC018833]|uniref:hypothetical protein n=1 Tax=Streptomyces sp. NPDC018833 TaxID=3365053 RepID=UPI0037AABE80